MKKIFISFLIMIVLVLITTYVSKNTGDLVRGFTNGAVCMLAAYGIVSYVTEDL